jgi:predicted DNA-binding transcriptional regulator YafY
MLKTFSVVPPCGIWNPANRVAGSSEPASASKSDGDLMSEQTPLQRALRILQLLFTHDGLTVRELHERLERGVSLRSVQRTLAALEEAHVPLRRSTGPHGEHRISLIRGFDFVPAVLTADEALAAILLGRYSEHFAGSPLGETLSQVIGKLEQLLPVEGIVADRGLLGLGDALAFREPGRVREPAPSLLLALLGAILERRLCRVRYRRLGGGEREYAVRPYSLVFSSGAIYTVVQHTGHADWIHLALQRLLAVEPLEERFEREHAFSLGDFLNGAFGIWREEPQPVRIRFAAAVAEFVDERLWHPSQQTRPLEDGGLELSMCVGLSSELLAWVMRWGAFAEVLEPAEFRQRVATALRAAADRYSPEGTGPGRA